MENIYRDMKESGIQVLGEMKPSYAAILSPEALAFVAVLTREFRTQVGVRLAARREAQASWDAGVRPGFLAETASIRSGDWTVASLPECLSDRRVEITGPVDRKMIINALNSGANVFMADFEDSNAPTWANQVEGQVNLRDAVQGTIRFTNEKNGKVYTLQDDPALLMVRPRGWHLLEKNLLVDGEPVPAGLFDFGLFFFHNAEAQIKNGVGPFFYLPKMQSHLEARLWNDVFVFAQDRLGVAQGTIKATVLIETLPAAFEMDEILYELRAHSAGLNCGRWDYIFSFIKTFQNDSGFVIPDRDQVGMTQPFMRAYTQLLIKTCHRREVHAMGGMAAQIPIKNNQQANDAALEKVRVDKRREVEDGHDGTWVAHPALVPLAREIFDKAMPSKNQIANKREDVQVGAADLIAAPTGTRSKQGLLHSVKVGVQYLEAWLGGFGCVPLYHLMEDAATAEISRTQVWQWIHHGAELGDGTRVTKVFFLKLLEEAMAEIETEIGSERLSTGRFETARELFEQLSTSESCGDFLTLPAYEYLLTKTHRGDTDAH